MLKKADVPFPPNSSVYSSHLHFNPKQPPKGGLSPKCLRFHSFYYKTEFLASGRKDEKQAYVP